MSEVTLYPALQTGPADPLEDEEGLSASALARGAGEWWRESDMRKASRCRGFGFLVAGVGVDGLAFTGVPRS